MSIIRDENHVKNICKSKGGISCCSYLGITGNGWECWKESVIKTQIDYKRAKKLMTAKGDNCPGYDSSRKTT